MEQATLSPPSSTPSASTSFPPGPRLPSIAQGIGYLRNPIDFLVNLQRRYGDIFTVSFPSFGRLVFVANPALVKAVFTGAPEQFHAGEANAAALGPVLGPNSLLTLDDAPHLRQRKLLLPPFHGERIQRYGEVMREVTLREMESWPVGKPFAFRAHTHRIALTVIMRTVYGVHEEERLAHLERLVETFTSGVNVIMALPALRRNLGPWSPWARFLRAREALDEFIYEEIANRRAEADTAVGGRDDVLSLLLAARHDDGSPMSDEEVRDQLVAVVGAGHETTATALAWTMERLLRTPRALGLLRESLAAGEDEYLEATIKETLRVRPVIVNVSRRLTAPATIGGYELPAGISVMPAIAVMHYRKDLFPSPDEFRPERFLEGKADTYVWIPFGGGVRRCIGAAFAEYEMKVILRTMIERADLSAPDPRPEKVKVRSVTLTPGKGTQVSLNRPLH